MGAKILKRYTNCFRIFLSKLLNFLVNGPHKSIVLDFLALLDYVGRAHEIEICPSSVIRPSSVRVAIISESNARISFKFGFCFP